MNTKEQILAEGCGRGDNAARRELYDRYAGLLLGVCLRYTGERASAEDVLHDAFLKIFGSIARFCYRGEGSLRAWMERIAVNTALERLRRERRLGEVRLDAERGAASRRRAFGRGDDPDSRRGADAFRERTSRRIPYGFQPLLHRGVFASGNCRDAGNQREEFVLPALQGTDDVVAENPRVAR